MTQGQHIVIVDDEPPAREMVGDYLRMHGFSVGLCDGGASLRQSIAQRMPDLIVLDLNMPEEDGLSIIRDLKSRINVPVIMLTATASPIDRVVGLELGADDYIAKPCELRELMARIRSVLRRSAPAKAAPSSRRLAGSGEGNAFRCMSFVVTFRLSCAASAGGTFFLPVKASNPIGVPNPASG